MAADSTARPLNCGIRDHCLVAEIAYDDAPIINANGIVAGPERSDKLAQRNLQLTFSDNPGPVDTHRIPQTFDLRPAPAIASRAGALLDYPDELMIDWGRTPAGAVAHIYWPQINAAKVLSLAGRLYGTHLLSAGDSNTIDCQVTNGVSYIPIPPGNIENIAGLLTVDLPQTVSIGQEFNIIVRRISTRRFKQDPIPAGREPAVNTLLELSLDKRGTESGPIEEPKEPRPVPPMRNWRYVTGTFQVKIPVTTPQIMLRPDEDALAVMKWRLQSMSPTNRWHLVLKRYIEYVSARIAGLGGNPNAIPPSPNGAPGPTGVKDVVVHTGKVVEIIYDCFGRFEALVLNECGVLHTFQSRECEIEKITCGLVETVYCCQFTLKRTISSGFGGWRSNADRSRSDRNGNRLPANGDRPFEYRPRRPLRSPEPATPRHNASFRRHHGIEQRRGIKRATGMSRRLDD